MKQNNIKILLVEDDKNAAYLLAESLKTSGYSVDIAVDGVKAYHEFSNNNYDLCIIDVMLPLKDGYSLTKEIRLVDKSIPIIFLTARTLSFDKIEGFKAGADDYITKPFNVDELLWRIKAILKRRDFQFQDDKKQIFKIGIFQLNYIERTLKAEDILYKLSKKEADLIKVFAVHKNGVISRNTILNAVWEKDDYYVSKSLDVHLTKIRKYFAHDENIEIVNIHGHGYKLIDKNLSS